jgi:hypothetical protein
MEHASEGESYPMRFHILEALSRFDPFDGAKPRL